MMNTATRARRSTQPLSIPFHDTSLGTAKPNGQGFYEDDRNSDSEDEEEEEDEAREGGDDQAGPSEQHQRGTTDAYYEQPLERMDRLTTTVERLDGHNRELHDYVAHRFDRQDERLSHIDYRLNRIDAFNIEYGERSTEYHRFQEEAYDTWVSRYAPPPPDTGSASTYYSPFPAYPSRLSTPYEQPPPYYGDIPTPPYDQPPYHHSPHPPPYEYGSSTTPAR